MLTNGYIELVKQRNEFARDQGYRNFFDYKLNKCEQMSPEALFEILDDFEKQTRNGNLNSINTLVNAKGMSAKQAHNFRFMFSGDVSRELDSYVPFSKSLKRWETFA